MLRVIGAPVDSAGAASADAPLFGCEMAPRTLRGLGLLHTLDAVDGGDLDVRIVNDGRDAATGVLGWPGVQATNEALRAAVIETLHAGDLPIVIGGCCSVLPAALAGARDALGVVGLAYVDGHLDLYDGRTSPTGEAADMPLAVALGHGSDAWLDQLDAPLVPANGAVILGARDRADARSLGSVLPEALGISSEFDPDTLRDLELERAGRDTERALTTVAEGFWLHLDVDVLSAEAMPATDYPQPGGLEWEELAALLAPLAASEGLVGFSLGCYNPHKDSPEFGSGGQLISLIAGLFRE
jgi:arginase